MARIKIPAIHPEVHPIIMRIHKEMFAQQMSLDQLVAKSGVGHSTIRAWFDRRGVPNFYLVECALNALGMALIASYPRGSKPSVPQKPVRTVARRRNSTSSTSTPAKATEEDLPAKSAPAPQPEKPKAESVVQRVSPLDVLAEPQPIPKIKPKIQALF